MKETPAARKQPGQVGERERLSRPRRCPGYPVFAPNAPTIFPECRTPCTRIVGSNLLI